ncbi:MAG: hypothetical protein M0Z62_02320 [Actinomycetota bacterium]|nr:hypothetical protein [Actinomycetota bacterium]
MGTYELRPLPEQLAALLAGERPDALDLVAREHASWHELHDRLIAIIVAFLDDAVERGEELGPLLERVVGRSSVGVDALVGQVPAPEAVATLLRAHHSVGTGADEPDGTAVFDHACGTGLAWWRANPDAPTVADGEVAGVPGGVPRYCARCITTIDSFSGGRWRVRPPAGPAGTCRWEVDRAGPSPA